MKIVLAVQRKIGQPNFGSEGASCEITLDVPETSARDSAMLVAEIRAAYDLAERAVGEQLARHGGPPMPGLTTAAPAQEVVAVADESAIPESAAPPAAPRATAPIEAPARTAARGGSSSANGGTGYRNDRGNGQPPRSGKALFAWCKDREAEHDYALLRYLNGWAKLQDFPGRMIDWNNDQVALAYSEACRKLSSLARADVPSEQAVAV